jgi:hypothetical protein
MVIHAAGHSGTVVNEVELVSEGYWVEDAGLLRQVGEHVSDPRPELVGGVLDDAPLGCLGGGGHRRAQFIVKSI